MAWQFRTFQSIPRQFTPHLHQNQPHGALTKAPGRAGSAGLTWGFSKRGVAALPAVAL